MRFTAQREALLAAAQAVGGVVERRQTMPILSNFLLRTNGEQLSLTGTDLELELVAHCDVSIEAPGAVTVPARKLMDICRGLPEGASLECALEQQRLRITSGRSRFLLATLPAAEFPCLDLMADGVSLELRAAVLRRLLDRTEFAMAHQDVRYYLNGLLLAITAQGLRAVATNGHRLALSDTPVATGCDEPIQVIVPRKAVVELTRLLAVPAEESAAIRLTETNMQVLLSHMQLTTKLIDGRFPDYGRVIPEQGDKRVSGDREGFRRALARTAILSNEKAKGVRLLLEQGRLRLQAQNPQREVAEDEIEVDYDGDPIEIGFNVTYLLDALAAMEGEKFALELSNPDSSGLLEEDTNGCNSRYVVMPMRL